MLDIRWQSTMAKRHINKYLWWVLEQFTHNDWVPTGNCSPYCLQPVFKCNNLQNGLKIVQSERNQCFFRYPLWIHSCRVQLGQNSWADPDQATGIMYLIRTGKRVWFIQEEMDDLAIWPNYLTYCHYDLNRISGIKCLGEWINYSYWTLHTLQYKNFFSLKKIFKN